MPNRADNDRIANRIIEQGWLKSQIMDDQLPSDNWRYVFDQDNRRAILYVVLFHTESGEPKEIPNEPDAIARLAEFYRTDPTLTVGPYLALAEMSDAGKATNQKNSQIKTLRLWNISSKTSPDVSKWKTADMPDPEYSFPRTTMGSIQD